MKKIIVLTCCLLLCLSVFPQKRTTTKKTATKSTTKVYNTTTDIFYGTAQCYYSSAKYTPEELRNAEVLSYALGYSSVIDAPRILKGTLSDDEYYAKIEDYYTNCKLPAGVVWENMRKQGLAILAYELKMAKLTNAAYADPSVLKTGEFSTYCTEYIDALNADDAGMMAAWKKLNTEIAKNNSDPDRIMKEFRVKANKTDWKKTAISDLMSYGWGNCINDFRAKGKFYEIPDSYKVSQTFRKLFTRIVEEEI